MIYVYVWTDVATLQRTKTERMKLLKQSPQGHLGCVFFLGFSRTPEGFKHVLATH